LVRLRVTEADRCYDWVRFRFDLKDLPVHRVLASIWYGTNESIQRHAAEAAAIQPRYFRQRRVRKDSFSLKCYQKKLVIVMPGRKRWICSIMRRQRQRRIDGRLVSTLVTTLVKSLYYRLDVSNEMQSMTTDSTTTTTTVITK